MMRTTKRNTVWMQGESDMVCSKQFIHGIPTVENLYPTLNFGYELPFKKARKTLSNNKLPSQNETLGDNGASNNVL